MCDKNLNMIFVAFLNNPFSSQIIAFLHIFNHDAKKISMGFGEWVKYSEA